MCDFEASFRLSFLTPRALVAVAAVLLLLPLALPAGAEEMAQAPAGDTSCSDASSHQLGSLLLTGETTRLITSEDEELPDGCFYCDLEACGCVAFPGCALSFSCTCSPIQCTRSCDNLCPIGA